MPTESDSYGDKFREAGWVPHSEVVAELRSTPEGEAAWQEAVVNPAPFTIHRVRWWNLRPAALRARWRIWRMPR